MPISNFIVFCRKEFVGKPACLSQKPWYNDIMKKIIKTEGMCCKKCAERAEKKLLLCDGVSGARANYKKDVILVESSLSDEELISIVKEAGFEVKSVSERKKIFSRL